MTFEYLTLCSCFCIWKKILIIIRVNTSSQNSNTLLTLNLFNPGHVQVPRHQFPVQTGGKAVVKTQQGCHWKACALKLRHRLIGECLDLHMKFLGPCFRNASTVKLVMDWFSPFLLLIISSQSVYQPSFFPWLLSEYAFLLQNESPFRKTRGEQ